MISGVVSGRNSPERPVGKVTNVIMSSMAGVPSA